MNYELAKELKDAGFRLDYSDQEWHTYRPTFPTLSELIEACDDLKSLHLGLDDLWEAEGGYYCCEEHGQGRKYAKGTTPEEAVARLWLALNKKV